MEIGPILCHNFCQNYMQSAPACHGAALPLSVQARLLALAGSHRIEQMMQKIQIRTVSSNFNLYLVNIWMHDQCCEAACSPWLVGVSDLLLSNGEAADIWTALSGIATD